jgi:hypothetical protein
MNPTTTRCKRCNDDFNDYMTGNAPANDHKCNDYQQNDGAKGAAITNAKITNATITTRMMAQKGATITNAQLLVQSLGTYPR